MASRKSALKNNVSRHYFFVFIDDVGNLLTFILCRSTIEVVSPN